MRGAALRWYSDELNDRDKIALRVDLSQWYTALAKRFRENPMVATRKLNEVRYTRQDVRNGVTPGSYIARVLRLAEASYTPEHPALLVAYGGLEAEMRRDIKMPTASTTKEEFIQQMEDQRYNWEEIFGRYQNSHKFNTKSRPRQQIDLKPSYSQRPSYQPQPVIIPYPQPVYPPTPHQNWPPQGYNSYWENKSNQSAPKPTDQPQLPAPKQPLMITAGSAAATQRRPPHTFGRGTNFNARGRGRYERATGGRSQPYQHQSYYPTRTCHGAEEPNLEDEVSLDQTHDEQDYGPDQDIPDPEPTDQATEEHFAGHVDILPLTKRTCRNCSSIFSSGNLLHKHLRGKDCSKKHTIETHQSDQARQLSQAAVLKPTRSYFALLDTCESVKRYNIRKRPAPSQIGDGKVFRKFHYATCRALLSLNSVLEQICLDSGCTMTIGDREWIKKLRPDLEIHRMKDPITVRGIGTAKYPTDEYVILNIYIPGLVNGKIEVVQITAEVHLVRSLKARLLIGVDVLDLEGMDISFRD